MYQVCPSLLAMQSCKPLHRLAEMITRGEAPRGAVPAKLIDRAGVFDLDVDDDIWQDTGLEDFESGTPLWLSDDAVRTGIRLILDYDRCVEEEVRVVQERTTLQEWAVTQWEALCEASSKIGKHTTSSGLHKLSFVQQRMYHWPISLTAVSIVFVEFVLTGWEQHVSSRPRGQFLRHGGPLLNCCMMLLCLVVVLSCWM
jgi:hypothetical protein